MNFSKHGRTAKRKTKKTIVEVITSEKVIQAVMTGSVVAIITYSIASIALGVNTVLHVVNLHFPRPVAGVIGMTIIFYISYWADQNTERFRSMIEETTGEEANGEQDNG